MHKIYKNVVKYICKFKVAIIVAVLILIIAIVGCIFLKEKTNKDASAILELETMYKTIRNSYKNSPGYWGLNNKYIIENKLLKNIENGEIRNSFKKEVLVGSGFEAEVLMPGSKTFDIIYKGLNKKECISIISFDLSEEQRASLVLMMLKSEGETKEFNWGGDNKLPISVNMAKRFCKNKNDILWQFE